MSYLSPLICVVGPTATGKTSLGVSIAKAFQGEIVSADSMQIYQGIPIGTAQPSPDEMQGIPHHMIGFLPINKEYSVSDYVHDAKEVIQCIVERGRIPILVGGTGLYISSLLNNLSFSDMPIDHELRDSLLTRYQNGEKDSLFELLTRLDPDAAVSIHPNNVHRLIRALEINLSTGQTVQKQNQMSRKNDPIYYPVIVGLNYLDRMKLWAKIESRVNDMISNGLLEEARMLLQTKETNKTCFQSIAYKELIPFFEGTQSMDEAIEMISLRTRQYAKRQITWFRHNTNTNWFYIDSYSSASQLYADVNRFVQDELERYYDEEE